MKVASILEDVGCKVVGPAGTLDTAKAPIGEQNFDAALLDANLGGLVVEELAPESWTV